MDVELIKVLTGLGGSGLAIFVFYKLMTTMMETHSQDRKEDSAMWREVTGQQSDKTDAVIRELTEAIRGKS